MEPRRIRTEEELEGVLAATKSRPLVLLKHSTRCFASRFAHAEFERFAASDAARSADLAIVYVVEDRAISKAVAERLEIGHESPQAFVVFDGHVLWSDSHSGIDAGRIEQAVRGASPSAPRQS